MGVSMKFEMGDHREAPELSTPGEGTLTTSILAQLLLLSRWVHLQCPLAIHFSYYIRYNVSCT